MAADPLEAALDRVERNPDGSPARILRSAERLFAARGFDGVTTRDVAAEAGVNVATLHFHWTNKRTLYEAVCRRQARQLLAFVEGAIAEPTHEAASPSERIERGVERAVDLLIANPAIAPLAWQSVSGQAAPDLPTLLRHDVEVFRQLQAEVCQVSGEVTERESAFLLLAFFYFAVGLFSDSPLQRSLLQGSVYESSELQQEARSFARRLARRLLKDGSE
jgi:AcrR family transcriptional regulator